MKGFPLLCVPFIVAGAACGHPAPFVESSSFAPTSFIAPKVGTNTDLREFAGRVPVGVNARQVEFLLGQPYRIEADYYSGKGAFTWTYERSGGSEEQEVSQSLHIHFQANRVNYVLLSTAGDTFNSNESPRERIAYFRRTNVAELGGLTAAQKLIHSGQDAESAVSLLGEPDIVTDAKSGVNVNWEKTPTVDVDWQYRMWISETPQVLGSLMISFRRGHVASTKLALPRLK